LIGLVLITATSLTIFLSTEWRLGIIALAIQYLGITLLVLVPWPLSMAAVKLVAGWMSGAILGMAMVSLPTLRQEMDQESSQNLVVSRPFYLMAAILVGMVVISQTERILVWFPEIRLEQAWGGMLLIGMGLLKLGFTVQPLQATLGILTALSGFEILYATIERSALLAGLLAGITLGLALAGAYLMMAPHLEEI
jgi:hypothetical protein